MKALPSGRSLVAKNDNNLLKTNFRSMLILLLFYAGGEICYSQVQIVYVLSGIF